VFVHIALEDMIDSLGDNSDEIRTADLIKLARVIKSRLEEDGTRLSPRARNMLRAEFTGAMELLGPEKEEL